MFFKKLPQIPSLSPRAFDLVTSMFCSLSSESVVFLYLNVEEKNYITRIFNQK